MAARWRNRDQGVPFVATLLVGGLLIAGARVGWPGSDCDADAISAQEKPQLGSHAVHVLVLSSTNKDEAMKEMACRFEATSPALDERPIDVTVADEPSGSAYLKIAEVRPTVWAPAATSWVRMLRQDDPDLVPDPSPPSIVRSPQVIAMPRPVADALGWPGRQLGWSDIVRYATDEDAWSSDAGPSWGSFRLAKTNPRLSTSGLNSTVATFKTATDRSSDLAVDDLEDPAVLDAVHAVESSTVHYAPTSVEFLTNLRAQDDAGNGLGYASAVLLEEKSVWDYNMGNPSGDTARLGELPPPATPLAAFYPREGALVADHPYVVLRGDWVSTDQAAAADRFFDFLIEPAQQERFQALGFRDHEGNPGPQIVPANGLLPREPEAEPLSPPGGDVLQEIYERWPTYRKLARTLIVLDVSGSMTNAVPGRTESKLDLAKRAALDALGQLGRHDEVGLWTFSPGSSGEAYEEVVPIDAMAENEGALREAIATLSADRENPSELCATVGSAVETMRDTFDPTRINGIVLLADGPNEGSAATDCDGLTTGVAASPELEVRIFPIAFGDQADVELLEGLAQASLGTFNDEARVDPTKIGSVFSRVVANF